MPAAEPQLVRPLAFAHSGKPGLPDSRSSSYFFPPAAAAEIRLAHDKPVMNTILISPHKLIVLGNDVGVSWSTVVPRPFFSLQGRKRAHRLDLECCFCFNEQCLFFPPDGETSVAFQVRGRIDVLRPSQCVHRRRSLASPPACICRKQVHLSCPVSSPNQLEGRWVGEGTMIGTHADACLELSIPRPVVTLRRVGDAAIPQITLDLQACVCGRADTPGSADSAASCHFQRTLSLPRPSTAVLVYPHSAYSPSFPMLAG
ncbi:uncharacterized protein B0H64DRAFT_86843 [Chaetomium fimeti]|uniref:Uncharacterized protein n=1 Tax=Chaetomium fimeti TaxID=1854472 RepID=A0AAE0HLZ4_9PEZI|nr:hypothetical protein B0H64DRAFT_86843 [Chaetomium fimeti]